MKTNHVVQQFHWAGIQWTLYDGCHGLYTASEGRDGVLPSLQRPDRIFGWAVVTLVTAPCIALRKLLLIE